MKKITVNILCSTGITLIVLAAIGTIFGATFLFISSVFQCFLVNIITHVGLLLIHKIESAYSVLEYTMDIGYTIAMVLVFGAVFNWYSSTPMWVLLVMSVVVYLLGILLSTIQVRQEISEINELLKKRNQSG